MAQLQVNSERFDLQVELSAGEPFGHDIPLVLLLTGTGEASVSPAQALTELTFLGTSPQQTRTIGNSVYTDRPQAAGIDGGRPWVSSPRRSSGEMMGLLPGGLEGDASGPQGTFSKLIETINGAQDIVESGPVTVDGQRVTEFDAALDPTTYLEKLGSQTKQTLHPLSSLFEEPEANGGKGKAPARSGPPPTFELEVFIAPNGLPVRDRFTLKAENTTVAVRVDTLAINIPVSVTPPPAAQTISEARLKQIERRITRRRLAQALRNCRRLHGKRAALCRRLARAQSRAPSAGGSGSGSGGSLL